MLKPQPQRRVLCRTGPIATAAQNDVTVAIAARADNAREALFGHGQEVVGVGCRHNRITSDFNATSGAIFEAYRHG